MSKSSNKNSINNGKTMDNRLVRNKKGRIVSGVLNPVGMKVGTKHFNTKYREALARIATEENMDPEDIDTEIVCNLVKDARNGNLMATKILLGYRFGMPVAQNLNVNMVPEKQSVLFLTYPEDDIAYAQSLINKAKEEGSNMH